MRLLYFVNRRIWLELDPLDIDRIFVEEFMSFTSVVADVLPALELEFLFEINEH